jgi:hypothetical protein
LGVFTASIVGGLGSSFGAVLGAVYLRGVEWFVTSAEWRFLSSGVGVLAVLLILPGGLAALIFRIRDELARRIETRYIDARNLVGGPNPAGIEDVAPAVDQTLIDKSDAALTTRGRS